MLSFFGERLVRLVLVLIGITLASFGFLHLVPGDPVQLRLGDHASPAEIAALTQQLGLDRPWWMQIGAYFSALLRGDFGTSIADSQSVLTHLSMAFPATVELTIGALSFALLVGVPAGVYAATHRDGLADGLTSGATLLGVSIPIFWLGWMLVFFFAVLPSHAGINLFPISGRISYAFSVPPRTHLIVLDAVLAGRPQAALDALWHLILPAVTLGTIPLAIVTKITRGAMLEVLGSDYIRTARAKGLSERSIVMRHALRNALVPILTVFGLQTGLLLGGAVLTESVFAWPGVGRLVYDAISNRDLPMINGCVLLFATTFVVVNTAVDVLCALANPRIRHSG